MHDEIWLPHLKELHYFDRKFPIAKTGGIRISTPRRSVFSRHVFARLQRLDGPQLMERLSIRRWPDLMWEIRYLFGDWSDEWYASLFENARGRLPGEITPAYSCLSKEAISHVHSLMPNAKLILLMRDPIERAWSHAKMDLAQATGQPTESIDATAYLTHFDSYASRRRGDYLETVRCWLAHFAERQLFLGFYDEILSGPENLLARIFEFLEVSAAAGHIPSAVRTRVNAGTEKPIPGSLRRHLAQIYVDDVRELARQYGQYPQLWLRNCERALDTNLDEW
jgi:hypothetical protein